MNIVIPIAGRGERTFQYGVPKPLIPIAGVPMIALAVRSLGIEGKYIFVRLRYENDNWNKQLTYVLHNCARDVEIYTIDEVTEGPACSALVAKPSINFNHPLIVTNCDQIMRWDPYGFVSFATNYPTAAGVVVTYKTQTPKNSYIRLDDYGNGVEIREKEPISEHSLNGIHYWRRGDDFVWSVEEMMRRNLRVNGEFYIAPTYNMLMERGMIVRAYPIRNEEHWAVGTPEDIDRYEEMIHNENPTY